MSRDFWAPACAGGRADMPRHAETRHLPYTPEQLFDLVADVARYGEFLPWVSAVRVRSDSETEMVADVIVGFSALKGFVGTSCAFSTGSASISSPAMILAKAFLNFGVTMVSLTFKYRELGLVVSSHIQSKIFRNHYSRFPVGIFFNQV